MMKFDKILTCSIVFGVFAGLCPAPIPDSRPTPPPVPEQSQAQLAEQQRFNGVQNEVGGVPMRQDSVTVRSLPSDARATEALIQAEKTPAANIARENLLVSERVLSQQGESPMKGIAWGVVVLLLAIGAVFGLRTWADKAIPVPEAPKPKTRW